MEGVVVEAPEYIQLIGKLKLKCRVEDEKLIRV